MPKRRRSCQYRQQYRSSTHRSSHFGYIQNLQRKLDIARAHTDSVYTERNRCITALISLYLALGIHCGLGFDEWEVPGFQHVIYANLPTGQISWHIPDHEVHFFEELGLVRRGYTGSYDGHTTYEKYNRIALLDTERVVYNALRARLTPSITTSSSIYYQPK